MTTVNAVEEVVIEEEQYRLEVNDDDFTTVITYKNNDLTCIGVWKEVFEDLVQCGQLCLDAFPIKIKQTRRLNCRTNCTERESTPSLSQSQSPSPQQDVVFSCDTDDSEHNVVLCSNGDYGCTFGTPAYLLDNDDGMAVAASVPICPGMIRMTEEDAFDDIDGVLRIEGDDNYSWISDNRGKEMVMTIGTETVGTGTGTGLAEGEGGGVGVDDDDGAIETQSMTSNNGPGSTLSKRSPYSMQQQREGEQQSVSECPTGLDESTAVERNLARTDKPEEITLNDVEGMLLEQYDLGFAQTFSQSVDLNEEVASATMKKIEEETGVEQKKGEAEASFERTNDVSKHDENEANKKPESNTSPITETNKLSSHVEVEENRNVMEDGVSDQENSDATSCNGEVTVNEEEISEKYLEVDENKVKSPLDSENDKSSTTGNMVDESQLFSEKNLVGQTVTDSKQAETEEQQVVADIKNVGFKDQGDDTKASVEHVKEEKEGIGEPLSDEKSFGIAVPADTYLPGDDEIKDDEMDSKEKDDVVDEQNQDFVSSPVDNEGESPHIETNPEDEVKVVDREENGAESEKSQRSEEAVDPKPTDTLFSTKDIRNDLNDDDESGGPTDAEHIDEYQANIERTGESFTNASEENETDVESPFNDDVPNDKMEDGAPSSENRANQSLKDGEQLFELAGLSSRLTSFLHVTFESVDGSQSQRKRSFTGLTDEEEKIDLEESKSFTRATLPKDEEVGEGDRFTPFSNLLKTMMEETYNCDNTKLPDCEETDGFEVMEGWSTKHISHVHVIGVGDITTPKEGNSCQRRRRHQSGGLIRLFGRDHRHRYNGGRNDYNMTYMVAPCLGKSNKDDVTGYEVLRMAI